MGRWSQYDEDDYRLPEGFKRIGYDADTQEYTYQDRNGKIYEGYPGSRYGIQRRVISKIEYSTAISRADYEERWKPVRSSPPMTEFPDTWDPIPSDPLSKRITAPIRCLRRSLTSASSRMTRGSTFTRSNSIPIAVKNQTSSLYASTLQRAKSLGGSLNLRSPLRRRAQTMREYIQHGWGSEENLPKTFEDVEKKHSEMVVEEKEF